MANPTPQQVQATLAQIRALQAKTTADLAQRQAPAGQPPSEPGMPSANDVRATLAQIRAGVARPGMSVNLPAPAPELAPAPHQGFFSKAADVINNGVQAFGQLPGIKQLGEVAGDIVAVPSALIGGAVGGVGGVIANAAMGRPLTQDLGQFVSQNAQGTAGFGQKLGQALPTAVALGAGGRIVNGVVGAAQAYKGLEGLGDAVKSGDVNQGIQSGSDLAMGLIGAHGAFAESPSGSRTDNLVVNRDNVSAVKNGIKNAFGGDVPPPPGPDGGAGPGPQSTPPPGTAQQGPFEAKPAGQEPQPAPPSTKNPGGFRGLFTVPDSVKESPIYKRAGVAAGDLQSGKTFEQESGVDRALLSDFEPSRRIPTFDPKTGLRIPDDVVARANARAAGRPDEFAGYKKIATKSVLDGGPTAFDIVGRRQAGTALQEYQAKLNKWGQIKREELAQHVGELVGIKDIRQQFHDRLAEDLGTQIEINGDAADGSSRYSTADAPGRASHFALDPADNTLASKFASRLDRLGDSSNVRLIDDTVDSLQDLLYKRKQDGSAEVNSELERIAKSTLGELNARLKKVVGERYAKSNAKYSRFVNTFHALNHALGPEDNRAGSLVKRVFSPTDGGTKALFAKVKRDTGIDLAMHARMAKQAGELAGDTRQRGLLESVGMLRGGIPTGPVSLLEKGYSMLMSHGADQEKILQNAMKQKTGIRREGL